jgi:hypothetical protein
MMFYRLDDEHVRMLLDLCREHLRHGETVADKGSVQVEVRTR